MKPKASSGRPPGDSMASGHDDYDDISLEKAYETVGLLITESRIPDSSTKGRREGEHIVHNGASHKSCVDKREECRKVKRYREAMGQLCHNAIPLCVEVLLCPRCEIEYRDTDKTTPSTVYHTHEVGSAHSDCFVLLEQWTIQEVCPRADSKPQSLQNLCNAVRSHLCFSQLSAWLQASQGVTPRHIFYRLTAPGEWFVHKFVMSPQSHKFPDASLGRPRSTLRVTLSSLPRTALTPYEISIADRDKLFGVKDASPLLRKTRSSGMSDEELDEEVARSVTPNERTHGRSKSVRGIHDLTGRKSASELKYPSHSRVQRCLKYIDDSDVSHSPSLDAAEKLASFTALPANSINKLELISCTTGKAPTRAPHPTRLSITSQRVSSLKSPKVLFTRTAASNVNFFSVPPLDFSSASLSDSHRKLALDLDQSDDEKSVLNSTEDFEKPVLNLEKDEDLEPHFELGGSQISAKGNHEHISRISQHKEQMTACQTSNDNLTSTTSSHHEPNSTTSCNCSDINRSTDSHGKSDTPVSFQSFSSYTGCNSKLKHYGNGLSQPHTPRISHSTDLIMSEVSTNQGSSFLSEDQGVENVKYKRKSRRHQNQESLTEANLKHDDKISNTPINKKLQHVKQTSSCPLPSRSRMFKQRPLQSSPAPVKRIGKANFGYDETINSVKSIKNALSCTSLAEHDQPPEGERSSLTLSSSAPAFSTSNKSHTNTQSRSSLLGNFEESLLNCRIDPAGVVDGFTVDIGASGSFCPKHVTLPVEAYFFNSLSDDDAPSPYLGYVDLSEVNRRGYQIPRKGTLQITLFYPNHKVNKMFVVTYDLTDMPPKSQTFIRQKTVYAPCEQQLNTPVAGSEGNNSSSAVSAIKRKLPTYLRYLIHLRILSTKTNKIFLHTDIRLIYARDRFEFDPKVASYELRSFIEAPTHPKYSPLK